MRQGCGERVEDCQRIGSSPLTRGALNDEVQQLRNDITEARATKAQAEFKYGVVTAYTAGIIISARVHFERLDELGVEHGQLPVPPAIVWNDLGWTEKEEAL